MDTSDVLLAARDALREHGWTQGELREENGAACVMGAFDHVRTSHGVDTGKARKHLFHYCVTRYVAGPVWVNDMLLTSEGEACDLLEAAAKWDGGTDG